MGNLREAEGWQGVLRVLSFCFLPFLRARPPRLRGALRYRSLLQCPSLFCIASFSSFLFGFGSLRLSLSLSLCLSLRLSLCFSLSLFLTSSLPRSPRFLSSLLPLFLLSLSLSLSLSISLFDLKGRRCCQAFRTQPGYVHFCLGLLRCFRLPGERALRTYTPRILGEEPVLLRRRAVRHVLRLLLIGEGAAILPA